MDSVQKHLDSLGFFNQAETVSPCFFAFFEKNLHGLEFGVFCAAFRFTGKNPCFTKVVSRKSECSENSVATRIGNLM